MDPLHLSELRHRLDSAPKSRLSEAFVRRPAQERIIEAADYLFKRWGLRSVTLERIAERAETSTNYVIECFGSLAGVIVDFLRHDGEARTLNYSEFWRALEREHGRAADKQLRDWIRVVAPDPREPFQTLPLSCEAMELSGEPYHKGQAVIRQYKAAVRDEVARLCCDAFYRDPEALADKLLMLVEGARVQAATFGAEKLRKRLIEAAEDLFKRHWQPQ